MARTCFDNRNASNPKPKRKNRRWLSGFVLVVGCMGACLIVFSDLQVSALSKKAETPTLSSDASSIVLSEPSGDFATFSHTQTHAALPCLLCHRREGTSSRPAFPGHTPCAGCHSQQFANSGSPVCAICHTDAASGGLKPFPSLRSFGARFDHARHLSGAARPSAGCAACHKPERNGVALSILSGPAAHVTCYQCHSPQEQAKGRDISSCGKCHTVERYAWAKASAPAYRVNFSHARHLRQRLSCTDCHHVRAGAPPAQQVLAPAPLEHHASAHAESCRTCHNDRRAFGIANFANCKKCHQAPHFYF
jgi:c(7)-type cytochrome triheme protein